MSTSYTKSVAQARKLAQSVTIIECTTTVHICTWLCMRQFVADQYFVIADMCERRIAICMVMQATTTVPDLLRAPCSLDVGAATAMHASTVANDILFVSFIIWSAEQDHDSHPCRQCSGN